MDPQDPDLDAEAASMAEMMGFSAFGSQAPPSKKRRYNPRLDAVIAAEPRQPPAPRGTGANTLPLLPRGSSRSEPVDGGVEEGNGAGEEQERVVSDRDGEGLKERVTDDAEEGGDDERGPRYIDTSKSPLRTAEEETSSAPLPGAIGLGTVGRDGGSGERIWWTDYYDPSSNENPWELLEKARGLEPVGSWLPRGHAVGRGQKTG